MTVDNGAQAPHTEIEDRFCLNIIQKIHLYVYLPTLVMDAGCGARGRASRCIFQPDLVTGNFSVRDKYLGNSLQSASIR